MGAGGAGGRRARGGLVARAAAGVRAGARLGMCAVVSMCVVVGAGATLGGCAGGGVGGGGERSTRLRASDLDIAVTEVRESLAASAFLAGRTGESPVIRLVPSELENLSSDRLSRIDRWAAVSRVLFDPGMKRLLAGGNVELLMPRDGALLLTRYGLAVDPDARVAPVGMDESPDFAPTHVLGGKVLSITRGVAGADAGGGGGAGTAESPTDVRQDLVRVEYTIVDLSTRRVEWSAAHEFKRAASGIVVD